MKAIVLVLGLGCAMVASVVFAEDKSVENSARKYTDAFLGGNMQPLLDHTSPELRALMKDTKSMRAMRDATTGQHATVADEQATVTYMRLVKSAKGQTWSITSTVTGDGQIVGFQVSPASEAASSFLDYKTKADLRLPFSGTWRVVWGGRSVSDNYHAAYADRVPMLL